MKSLARCTQFYLGLVFSACLLAGDEKPTLIERAQLAFLKEQREPRLTQEMRRRLGTTVLGRGNPGFEPVYRYLTDRGEASIDFWHKDFPVERLRGLQTVILFLSRS
jgi:hypothetical protein